MRIIAFMEDYRVIKKILDYLGIYEFKRDRPLQDNWLLLIRLMTTIYFKYHIYIRLWCLSMNCICEIQNQIPMKKLKVKFLLKPALPNFVDY